MDEKEILDQKPKRNNDGMFRGLQIIRSFCLAFGLVGLGLYVTDNSPQTGRYVIFGSLILYAVSLLAEFLFQRSQRND